jgi:hypothetical protein
VDRLLGGVLSEDWETVAPHVMGDGSNGIQGFDLTAKTLTRPQGAMVVLPNVGYKQQLAMAIYGTMFSRLSSDLTLLNKMRLSIDGDKAPLVPGTREVRFQDPVTGFSYIAGKFGDDLVDAQVVDHGIASRMIGRANQLAAQAYVVKKDAVTGQPMVDDRGQWVLDVDATGEPIQTTPAAQLKLRRYVGLMDAVRQIAHALDGPLGGAGGGGE